MNRRAKEETGEGGRLDANSWTRAALDLLAEQGIDGVRIELLARRLKVTKGSFYWHFKDRDALHLAMLDYWRRHATIALIERLDRDLEASARLRKLLRLPFAGEKSSRAADVELAVRLWGRRDERARKALEEVDGLRTRYFAQLMVELGQSEETARARAILAYSYMRVAGTLIDNGDIDLMAQCEAALLGGACGT